MTEILVGTLGFTITGQTAKIYKEDVEGTHQNILGRDEANNSLVVQFIILDTAATQEILNASEVKFNNKGWY